ncbi:DUF1971 domain-containing protein [Anderseniella sp. Alg231-50]|uniref:DUF1971 domain-containing protein n=1 Tax=Anderseniella sp. Alg231-50 TaxID=1922226 RepID=UPI000D555EB9
MDASLPEGLVKYSQSPVFDQDSVPLALQKDHRTKAGVWARAVVSHGSIEYVLEAMPGDPLVVSAGQHALIEPEVPHHVRVIGPVEFQLEFFRKR